MYTCEKPVKYFMDLDLKDLLNRLILQLKLQVYMYTGSVMQSLQLCYMYMFCHLNWLMDSFYSWNYSLKEYLQNLLNMFTNIFGPLQLVDICQRKLETLKDTGGPSPCQRPHVIVISLPHLSIVLEELHRLLQLYCCLDLYMCIKALLSLDLHRSIYFM